MLIKRTPWFQDNDEFCFSHCFKNRIVSLCFFGVFHAFNVPYDAEYVRFYLYDRPSKNRAKCELVTCSSHTYVVVEGSSVNITPILPAKAANLLLAKQRFYYLECEYAY